MITNQPTRNFFSLAFWFLLITSLPAQKQDYIWIHGTDQGSSSDVQGLIVDFKNPPIYGQGITLANGVVGNNTSISDSEGNLLFWTNGCSVMNRNQKVMPHGDTLNWDQFRILLNWEDCDIGYPGFQNLKILKDPKNQNGYFLFHKTFVFLSNIEPSEINLRVSYIDMNLDNGLGDVVYFDSTLTEERLVSGHLESINHINNNDWWVIQPIKDESLFLTYLVDETGIHRHANQNSFVEFTDKRAGAATSRFSPIGTQFVFYDYFLNVHLYDFDRTNGILSNHQKITLFDSEELPNNQFKFGSVEWSPNGRFIYVTNSDSLMQIDTWEADIQDGITLIDTYDGTLNPFPNTFFIMQQAPDCKIYMSSTNGNEAWHVINNPDELGTACNFVQNGLKFLQPGTMVPTFPRFRVDEDEKCDPTITSIFGETVFYRKDIELYPNPSSDFININIPEGIASSQLIIYDLQGNIKLQQAINSNQVHLHIDIQSFPKGIYHLELHPSDNPERGFYEKQFVKVD